jgi:hypothetical protein
VAFPVAFVPRVDALGDQGEGINGFEACVGELENTG